MEEQAFNWFYKWPTATLAAWLLCKATAQAVSPKELQNRNLRGGDPQEVSAIRRWQQLLYGAVRIWSNWWPQQPQLLICFLLQEGLGSLTPTPHQYSPITLHRAGTTTPPTPHIPKASSWLPLTYTSTYNTHPSHECFQHPCDVA